jgi:hypothetical protein
MTRAWSAQTHISHRHLELGKDHCKGNNPYRSRRVSMNRLTAGIALGGSILVSANALAADAINQSASSKRQKIVWVAGCVRKLVSSRTVSYSDAIKTCKEQVNEPSAVSPSEPLVAATAQKS